MSVIQSIVLSDGFLIAVLLIAFAIVSRWAIVSLREYRGYALGWLLGLFFIVVLSSLMGESTPPPDAATEIETTLGFGQIIISTIIGGVLALMVIGLSILPGTVMMARALNVALLTGIGVVVLFLMFIAQDETRRMISIGTLAFGIGMLLSQIILTGILRSRSRQMPIPETQGLPLTSRVNAIREDMESRDLTNGL